MSPNILSNFLFVTPDFGEADIWHLSLSLKALLANSLKLNYFPLWAKDIGMGFPTLGEGQAGIFNISNLLIFKFIGDFPTAVIISYLVIFLTAFIGTYLFARILKLSRAAAVLFAGTFAFSGFFITHVPHFNLIQAASYFPWEFLFLQLFINRKKKIFLLGLSFIISQQINSGFQQITLISLIAVSLYLFINLVILPTFKDRLQLLIFYLLSLTGGIILAGPQVLGSLILISHSFRTPFTPNVLAQFPYPPVHLASFLYPYIFGDPRTGTYPVFSQNWGIFWESTGYIGILPFIIALLSAFRIIFSRNKSVIEIFAVTVGIAALVLMLGKSTPLFFIFQIAPLSYFRVPARFLLIFIWCLTLLSALLIDRIKSPILKSLILLVVFVDILHFSFTYNAVSFRAQKWLGKPGSVSIITNDDAGWNRIYPVASINEWNKFFLKTGWQNPEVYLPFRNNLSFDSSLIWNIPSFDYYRSGLAPKRLQLYTELLESGIFQNETTKTLIISTPSANLLTKASIKYIISPKTLNPEISLPDIYLIGTTSGTPPFYIYKNTTAAAHSYLTNDFTVADSFSSLIKKLTEASTSASTVVLESDPGIDQSHHIPGKATVILNDDLEVKIKSESDEKTLLILTDSYYPGWHAYLDGREVKILPANLNERAVIVPPGKHVIDYFYRPSLADLTD